MKTISQAILPISGVAVLWYGLWIQFNQPPQKHVAVGLDFSLSVERNCLGVSLLTRSLLQGPGIREGSSLTLLTMGASPRLADPDFSFQVPIPIASDDVLGEARKKRAHQQALDELSARLAGACEQAPDTEHTPLYRLVEQGLAHLRGLGCQTGGECSFLIKTDLAEDVDPELKAVLDQAAMDPNVSVPSRLVGSLDNRGVKTLLFCGTAEVRASSRTGASSAARQRIWNELFTNPELVSYQPFCSAAGQDAR